MHMPFENNFNAINNNNRKIAEAMANTAVARDVILFI